MTQELQAIIENQRQEIESLKFAMRDQGTKIMALQSKVQTVTQAGAHAAKRADEAIVHLANCMIQVADFGEKMIREHVLEHERAEMIVQEMRSKMPARVG